MIESFRLKLGSLFAVAAMFSLPELASAYTLQNLDQKNGCGGDGTECIVYCDSGDRAGSMWWNGAVWTDGVKWDRKKDVMIEMILAANGSSCT